MLPRRTPPDQCRDDASACSIAKRAISIIGENLPTAIEMTMKILIVSCDGSNGGGAGPMRPMATENIPRSMSSATREFSRLQKAAGGNKLSSAEAWF